MQPLAITLIGSPSLTQLLLSLVVHQGSSLAELPSTDFYANCIERILTFEVTDTGFIP